jgi:hypothetical protein
MDIKIKLSKLPKYLIKSELYKLYENNKDEYCIIPLQYYKKNTIIKNFDDFIKLLDIIHYWDINDLNYNDFYWFVMDSINNKNTHYKIEPNIINILLSTIDKYDNMILAQEIKYILIYDHEINDIHNNTILYNIIKDDYINCFHFLINCGYYNDRHTYNILKLILIFNSIKCFKYYYYTGWVDLLFLTAYYNRFECFKFLSKDNNEYCKEYICNMFAYNGNYEALLYAHQVIGCKFNIYTLDDALYNGNLECVKYIVKNNENINISDNTFNKIIENNNIDCLKYIDNKYNEIIHLYFSNSIYYYSILYNKFDCFKFAIDNKYKWDNKYYLLILKKNNMVIDYVKPKFNFDNDNIRLNKNIDFYYNIHIEYNNMFQFIKYAHDNLIFN